MCFIYNYYSDNDVINYYCFDNYIKLYCVQVQMEIEVYVLYSEGKILR